MEGAGRSPLRFWFLLSYHKRNSPSGLRTAKKKEENNFGKPADRRSTNPKVLVKIQKLLASGEAWENYKIEKNWRAHKVRPYEKQKQRKDCGSSPQ